jgi:hypothetical protein
MAKLPDYDIEDIIKFNQIRHRIKDPKWQNYGINTSKNKFLPQNTKINLGKHKKHNWQPLKGPFGTHSGKIICKTCNDKWIAWLPKGSI